MHDDCPTPPHDHAHSDSHEHGKPHDHDHGILASLIPFGHAHDHGSIDADLAENHQGVRVLMISLGILGITTIIQAAIFFMTNSVALLADVVHNLGDSLTSLPLALAFILSRRPPSRRFHYGLGRTEDLAGLAIVALIAFSGLFALYESIARLIHQQPPHNLTAGIVAGCIGFLGNEVVAVYRIVQGRRMASTALIADGQHARVDGIASLGVALGLTLVWLGFPLADPIVGLLISLTIAGITYKTAKAVGIRLLDGIEDEYLKPIEHAVGHVVPPAALIDVRTRWFGHVIHAAIEVDVAQIDMVELAAMKGRLEKELIGHGTRVRRVDVVAGSRG